jgi:hypothetical protein
MAIHDASNNPNLHLSWHVDLSMPGHTIYCARLDDQPGCGDGYIAAVVDPMKGNQRIIPNMPIGNVEKAEDPSRFRVNHTSESNVKFTNTHAQYE